MAERSDQRTRPADDAGADPLVDDSLGLDESAVGTDDPSPASDAGPASDTGGRTVGDRLRGAVRAPFSAAASRLTAPLEGLFSLRTFLVLFPITVAGMFLAGMALPLGSVGGVLGIAAVAFGAGLVGDRRRYTEATLSGALASGVSWLLGNLVLTAVGPGVPLVAAGVGVGAVAGLLGHYLGRDLRAGLTRDL